jgi:hypothetical protein
VRKRVWLFYCPHAAHARTRGAARLKGEGTAGCHARVAALQLLLTEYYLAFDLFYLLITFLDRLARSLRS